MTEADLDQLAGELFATPRGKEWLALMEDAYPFLVANIRQRIKRMRLRWGDISSD